MKNFGFIRVAAASPRVKVSDTEFNKNEIIALIDRAEAEKTTLLAFPELSVTGYTCGDLFGSSTLVESAEEKVAQIREYTRGRVLPLLSALLSGTTTDCTIAE